MAEEHGRSNGEYDRIYSEEEEHTRDGEDRRRRKSGQVQVDAAAGRGRKIRWSSAVFSGSGSNGVLEGQEEKGGRRRERG